MKIKPKYQAVLANKKGFLSPSDKGGEIMGALNSQENSFSVYYSVSSHVNTDYQSREPLPMCFISIFSAFIFWSNSMNKTPMINAKEGEQHS